MEDLVVSANFLEHRLMETEAFQTSEQTKWVWARKTVAGWGEERTLFDSTRRELQGLERDLGREGPGLDNETLKELHDLTVQTIGMARAYYRGNDTVLASLDDLTAKGGDREDILKQALNLELAWEDLPEADRDKVGTVTLAQFKAKRLAALARYELVLGLERDEHQKRIEFHELVNRLWQDCAAWYQAALLVFRKETPEGQNLRDSIPTPDDEVETQSSPGTSTPTAPPPDPAPGGTPS